MENNDSNIKPQQTGGLKLMTVFIVVLALHVVVIGGYSAYMLMSGGNAYAELTTTDKPHTDLKPADGSAVADTATADAGQGDKTGPIATPATPPAEVVTIPQAASGPQVATAPAIPSTPAPAPAASTVTTAPAPTPTPPAILAPPPQVVDESAPPSTTPISPELAPPADSVSVLSAPATVGPVHMPPPAMASAPVVHEHTQIYVVKITDSYKKIAHAHHVTVAQLKEANHIKGDVLHTGQKLVIPSEKTLVAESAPAPAASLDASPTTLVLSESTPAPTASLASASSTMPSAVSQHHLYTVVKGDTLTRIAHKFKTTTSALMSENSITDPTKLAIGKKLKIPSGESRSAGNAAPASTQPAQVQPAGTAPSGQLANFQR